MKAFDTDILTDILGANPAYTERLTPVPVDEQAVPNVVIEEIIRRDIPKPTITANVLVFYVVAKMNNNIIFYWAVLAVGHVVNCHRPLRDRELLTSQL